MLTSVDSMDRCETKIYVATHGAPVALENSLYCPIQVGAANTSRRLECLHDDEGINISNKNANYCELTALYWIWMNDVTSKHVGLCHYRRYFTNNQWSISSKHFLDTEDYNSLLGKSDVVVPKRFIWRDRDVRHAYGSALGRDADLVLTRETIEAISPEYAGDFDKVLCRNWAFYCNMFVMPFSLVDEYCGWLFDVLGRLERRVDLSDYSKEEKRIYGFLSEILFNAWICHNGLSYIEVPIVRTGVNPIRRYLAMAKNGKYYKP